MHYLFVKVVCTIVTSLLLVGGAAAEERPLLSGLDTFSVPSTHIEGDEVAAALGLDDGVLERQIAGALVTEGYQLNQGRFDPDRFAIVGAAPTRVTTDLYLYQVDSRMVTWVLAMRVETDVKSLNCEVKGSAAVWGRTRSGAAEPGSVKGVILETVDAIMTELVVALHVALHE